MKAELTTHSVIDNLTETGLADGDPEIYITTQPAELRAAGDILHLTYTESEGEARTDCHLTLYPDGKVSLSRRGAVVCDILFDEEEVCNTLYSIPPYKFDMTVSTRRIRSTLTPSGGEVQLLYSMNVGGQDKSVRMKLTVKVL